MQSEDGVSVNKHPHQQNISLKRVKIITSEQTEDEDYTLKDETYSAYPRQKLDLSSIRKST